MNQYEVDLCARLIILALSKKKPLDIMRQLFADDVIAEAHRVILEEVKQNEKSRN